MTKQNLIWLLRACNQVLGLTRDTEIVAQPHELDWSTFETPSTLPGIGRGHFADWRYATDSNEGLHAQVKPDGVYFHLDRYDPGRDLGFHGFADTSLAKGLGLGGLAGLFLATTIPGALLLVALGGVAGASTPARPHVTYRLNDLVLAMAAANRAIAPTPLPRAYQPRW